ncbi:helix-turn-helix domain-containing protein [Flavobacterium silvaticum]|uniref:Helix-turn-helix transcriptional regulator n=1 Tax=Flavobacterium silvaticum TaxID=1852020 RepID=A0A972FMP6_9FLAO|nr:AraC family transcriptional regulator [Flavobacterium silvaticum]NMH28861.1 helix-turn-helix transcriptional regulator [Flavobacterium silvaticum]
MEDNLLFRIVKPDESLSGFVESFWLLHNATGKDKEIVVLPDGRVDLILSKTGTQPFHIMLSGLETLPQPVILEADTLMCAVSFKLPATELLFPNRISNLLDYAEYLPDDFWGFDQNDLLDFDNFCQKAAAKITALLPDKTDDRKLRLFQLIYADKGNLTVRQLSEAVFWNSRQINRYFTSQFGLSLKSYCNILRFRESLGHLAKGNLFPELNFADQSHFIKQVRKFSGVIPKELLKNENDRFIQFSTLLPE